MRGESAANKTVISLTARLAEGVAVASDAKTWASAASTLTQLAEQGGVWQGICELWLSFLVCVLLLVLLSYFSKRFLGAERFLSDEDKTRKQLLEAIAKAERLSADIATTQQKLNETESGAASRKSSASSGSAKVPAADVLPVKGLDQTEKAGTPERTTPRSGGETMAAQATAGKAEAMNDAEGLDQVGEMRQMSIKWVAKNVARLKATISTLSEEEVEDLNEIRPPWTVENLSATLQKFRVPVETWAKASFETFVEELQTGQARLRMHGGHPKRDVDLMLLVVEHGKMVLQEQVDPKSDSGFPPVPEKTTATRLNVDEDLFQARKRLLKKAGIPEKAVRLNDAMLDVTDTVENMDLFPGLGSVVRKFLVRAEVIATDQPTLSKLGIPGGSMTVKGKSSTKIFKWCEKERSIGLLKYFSRANAAGRRASRKHKGAAHRSMRRTVDQNSEVLLPWTKEAVAEICEKHHVKSVQQEFGFPIEHLVAELNDGVSFFSLHRRIPDRLFIVRDVISLFLDDNGAAAVWEDHEDADSSKPKGAELPCELRYADESCLSAARRAAKIELGIHAVDLLIGEAPVEQASTSSDHYKSFDVHDWRDGERPPGRRLRHFVVHGQVKR